MNDTNNAPDTRPKSDTEAAAIGETGQNKQPSDLSAPSTRFAPGDRVQKVGGSYQATGVIKAAWLADDGTARYVFRFDNPAGMLHIFSDANLAAAS